MNIAVIFAGGTGQRMNTKGRPKQFLELHGKPLLIYTLEIFQNSPSIDGIILVMLESWILYSESLIERFRISKVKSIVAGGETGQESIYRGVERAYELYPDDSVVLVHDGVRPLIDLQTIEACINTVRLKGSAITVSPATETITLTGKEGRVGKILSRTDCLIAKAPQCFILRDIYTAHKNALRDNRSDFIDSASLMQFYGKELYTVEGPVENMKITTPSDFYIFRAIEDAKENSQIFGI